MEQIRSFFSYFREFSTVTTLLRIFLAVIAGGLIGNERGRHGRAAGFRTHILVCLGGVMTALCSLFVFTVYGYDGDIFRISAQVISGIGFLGAGIILVKNNNTVAGLTTAAGMWVTAIIGMAFGYGFYIGGAVATIICLINAVLLTRFEQNRIRAMRFYVEVNDVTKIQEILDRIESAFYQDALIETIPARSGLAGSVGFLVTSMSRSDFEKIKQEFNQVDEISFVVPG